MWLLISLEYKQFWLVIKFIWNYVCNVKQRLQFNSSILISVKDKYTRERKIIHPSYSDSILVKLCKSIHGWFYSLYSSYYIQFRFEINVSLFLISGTDSSGWTYPSHCPRNKIFIISFFIHCFKNWKTNLNLQSY